MSDEELLERVREIAGRRSGPSLSREEVMERVREIANGDGTKPRRSDTEILRMVREIASRH